MKFKNLKSTDFDLSGYGACLPRSGEADILKEFLTKHHSTIMRYDDDEKRITVHDHVDCGTYSDKSAAMIVTINCADKPIRIGYYYNNAYNVIEDVGKIRTVKGWDKAIKDNDGTRFFQDLL